jgi:hypothetical protein
MSQADILAKLFEATSHDEIDQLVSNLNRDMINAEGTKILRFVIFRAEEEKAYKCRRLLEAGACPNDSGCEGSLLLEAASRFKKCPVMQEIAELLKQHGATNPSSDCCDCCDSDSDSCCDCDSDECHGADCCGTKTITIVDCNPYDCTMTTM